MVDVWIMEGIPLQGLFCSSVLWLTLFQSLSEGFNEGKLIKPVAEWNFRASSVEWNLS